MKLFGQRIGTRLRAFCSSFQIVFCFTPITSDGCIVSFTGLVSLIANLIGAKLDLILKNLHNFICEWGHLSYVSEPDVFWLGPSSLPLGLHGRGLRGAFVTWGDSGNHGGILKSIELNEVVLWMDGLEV